MELLDVQVQSGEGGNNMVNVVPISPQLVALTDQLQTSVADEDSDREARRLVIGQIREMFFTISPSLIDRWAEEIRAKEVGNE